MPLKTTLRLILKQLGLAYIVKDGRVIISSAEGIGRWKRRTDAQQPPKVEHRSDALRHEVEIAIRQSRSR